MFFTGRPPESSISNLEVFITQSSMLFMTHISTQKQKSHLSLGFQNVSTQHFHTAPAMKHQKTRQLSNPQHSKCMHVSSPIQAPLKSLPKKNSLTLESKSEYSILKGPPTSFKHTQVKTNFNPPIETIYQNKKIQSPIQQLFLVPLYNKWYSSCQLGDYMVPIPPIKGTRKLPSHRQVPHLAASSSRLRTWLCNWLRSGAPFWRSPRPPGRGGGPSPIGCGSFIGILIMVYYI